MSIEIAAASAATTATGTTDGYVTVADAAPFYPGATVFANGKEYTIVDVLEATNEIGLRLKKDRYGGVTYGRTSVSDIALGTVLSQPRQLVPVSWTGPKSVRPQGGR